MNWPQQFMVCLTLTLLGCSGCQQQPVSNTLVSTQWLLERIDDPSFVILHIGSRDTFDSVHIIRSRFISAQELMVDKDSLRHELPDIETIDSLLSQVGINQNSRIVLCYENEKLIPLTARVFLTLDFAGLRKQTLVLNGGLKKWIHEDLPVTDSVYEFPDGNLNLTANPGFLLQAEEVKQYLKSPEYVVLDARPLDYYTGSYDSIEMKFTGGHIEGALNLPFESFFLKQEPHMFVENKLMIEEFEKNGLNKSRTAVLYCGSGVWASVNYLVLTHLGYNALFFDGSFEGWEHLDLPIVKPVSLEVIND